MPKEKKIGRRTYRLCHKYGIWISNDGERAFKEYKSDYMAGGTSENWYTLKEDKEGNKVIRTQTLGYVRVDELVSTCFCPPKHGDGKAYEIFHKDGDKANCSASNLEWRLVAHIKDSATGLEKVNVFNDVWVWENGDIYEGKKKLDYYNHMYDSDIDLYVAIGPDVIIQGTGRKSVESMMQMADFVRGHRSRSSVILHKDNNFMNCSMDNLEYVECDNPAYEKYNDQMVADMKEINIRENGGKFPEIFQPKTMEEKRAGQIKKHGKRNGWIF